MLHGVLGLRASAFSLKVIAAAPTLGLGITATLYLDHGAHLFLTLGQGVVG